MSVPDAEAYRGATNRLRVRQRSSCTYIYFRGSFCSKQEVRSRPWRTHTHPDTDTHWTPEERREGRLGECYLDSLYPESQGGRWADGLSPLHVSGLGHRFLLVLLGRGRRRIHLDHFLIHVRSRRGLLTSLGQFFLKVGPESEGEETGGADRRKRWERWAERGRESRSDVSAPTAGYSCSHHTLHGGFPDVGMCQNHKKCDRARNVSNEMITWTLNKSSKPNMQYLGESYLHGEISVIPTEIWCAIRDYYLPQLISMKRGGRMWRIFWCRSASGSRSRTTWYGAFWHSH